MDSRGEQLALRNMRQRGPTWGRGPGRPWRGIVERTPAVWISWIKDLCRMTGNDIERLRMQLYDDTIEIIGVQLTFGTRHYFLCPKCWKRCEALYFVRRALCRRCARLGYISQCHRPSSAFGEFARLYTRRGLWKRVHGSRFPRHQDRETLLKVFRETLEAHFRKELDAIEDAITFSAEMEKIRGR